MRFYVQNYNLVVSNNVTPIREIGLPNAVAMLNGVMDFKIHCDLIPVLDQGESPQDILTRLAIWLDGTEINMVRAFPDKPRCFYCGVRNEFNSVKCPYCGGEMR